ncbi:dUTP diphosphatase [Thiomicrorhabdus sp. 6S3-12]|uniref:dUTP diphosphatase n=1 Tax=Thiomicrorhabdus sp. 6S3-12 TaxID=2819681 RepID=UPI001AAC566A|nr:dUTP diphosphatase [Thiomicrorhabdus sp. 6S3-12]MBO1924410.1 dUTP diphosphatase [Thiomicrorhabdus sp. 6S3-12]
MKRDDFSVALREMLQMQNELNNATNGDQWRSGKTQLGKTIDWRRCIVMETAELIDSYPWKHWKSVDAETDIENVRIELVDIWHFLLSLALENFELDQAQACILQAMQNDQPMDLSEDVIEQVRVHEQMMAVALESTTLSEAYLEKLSACFLRSCRTAGLDFARLYQIYMAKNVLNQFRQDHGYKEGTYRKHWDGREDNVVMFEIIEEMSSFSGETLYQSLKIAYSRLD